MYVTAVQTQVLVDAIAVYMLQSLINHAESGLTISDLTASHEYKPFVFILSDSFHHCYAYNFCMRVSRAERTAWISDPEQVQTTGSFWACSSSATYCRNTYSVITLLQNG